MSHALSASRRTLVAVALMALLLAVALLSAGPAHHAVGGQTWNKTSKPAAGQTWNKTTHVLAGQTWNTQGGRGGQTWN